MQNKNILEKSVLGTLLCSFCLLIFFSCKKTESAGIGNSGLVIIGDQKDAELISIEPHPDGGFIVGAQSRQNENQEIWILKYNNNFDLEWQKTMGSNMSNKLLKIFIDKDKNIAVGGLTYGFGQDTVPLSVHKFWLPYFHLLSPSGNTIDEQVNSSFYSAGSGSGIVERITDIVQDKDGDYLVAGEFSGSPIHSTIIKYVVSGDSFITYAYNYNTSGKMEALFANNDYYSAFNYWSPGNSIGTACAFKIEKVDTNNVDLYTERNEIAWPWPSGYQNGSVAGLKLVLASGTATFNYIFENSVYRYSFNPNSPMLTGASIPLQFNNLIEANTTYDGHFLLGNHDGIIYETNSDFSILSQFKTEWKVKTVNKLFNNEYVLGVQKGKSIYLVHYTQEGIVKNHE